MDTIGKCVSASVWIMEAACLYEKCVYVCVGEFVCASSMLMCFVCVCLYAGKQKDSVLCVEQHFKQRGKQFKREMDHLRSSNHKEMIFEASTPLSVMISTNVYHPLVLVLVFFVILIVCGAGG